MAASRVEKDEVVVDVGLGGDEGFQVEGVESAAAGEVSSCDAGFEEKAEAQNRSYAHLPITALLININTIGF